jgi:hypothetical protein
VAIGLDEEGRVCLDALDPTAVGLEDRSVNPPLRIGRDVTDRYVTDRTYRLKPGGQYYLIQSIVQT